MGIPVWVTSAGDLGVIADNVFFTYTFNATDTANSPLTFKVVSGAVPQGLTLTTAGILSGTPIKTTSADITQANFNKDVVSKFVIRVTNNLGIVADRTFTVTVTGESPPEFITTQGSLGTYYTGQDISYQLQASDIISGAVLSYTLYSGSLPPGLTLSSTGLISGHIQNAALSPDLVSNYDEGPYDVAPFDFIDVNQSLSYEFVVQLSDGISYTLGAFSFFVISREGLTADSTFITADETPVPTVDSSNLSNPYMLTPSGNIGTLNEYDYFTYKFSAFDPDGDAISYQLGTPLTVDSTFITVDTTKITCDAVSVNSLPIMLTLTLDPNTGWLYGSIPVLPIGVVTFSFTVSAYKTEFAQYVSQPVTYTLTANGEFADVITWITPSNLGTIDNGAISTLSVEAVSSDGATLTYAIAEDTNSSLPQGLTLFQDGLIAGRTSFRFFEFDGGTTTFDNNTTVFESSYSFTINALNTKKNVTLSRTFTVKIDPVNGKPYQDLYLVSYTNNTERATMNSLLGNPSVFPPSQVYRYNDTYFGVATNLNMLVMTGINPVTAEYYIEAMQFNHYTKSLYFGNVETAVALNSDGSTLYEVVYVQLVDPQDNALNQSTALSISGSKFPETVVNTVYPNSIENMKYQIANGEVNQYLNYPATSDTTNFTADDTNNTADESTITDTNSIGIENYSTLPLWMTSIQPDGQILGFTKAFVLCYCNPGESARIKYNVDNYGIDFKTVEFKADRYVWDNSLSEFWNAPEQEFYPRNQTTFDKNTTTFDKNSTRFFSETDTYQPFMTNDSWLKFPKYNILS